MCSFKGQARWVASIVHTFNLDVRWKFFGLNEIYNVIAFRYYFGDDLMATTLLWQQNKNKRISQVEVSGLVDVKISPWAWNMWNFQEKILWYRHRYSGMNLHVVQISVCCSIRFHFVNGEAEKYETVADIGNQWFENYDRIEMIWIKVNVKGASNAMAIERKVVIDKKLNYILLHFEIYSNIRCSH